VKALLKLHGVQLNRVDQCTGGSLHLKPTGVLTNAPWLVERRCDPATRPHHHVPLMGLVKDLRTDDLEDSMTQCFYTELAAEYPEGLCGIWAQGFRSWIQDFISDVTNPTHGYMQLQCDPLEEQVHQQHRGLGGLAFLKSTHARTGHDPGPHSGTGIVGEWMRRGKFGNCIYTPARLAQIKCKEQTVVDIDSSGCSLRRGVKLPSAKEAREAQNAERVGGLRNPITAVASSTSLKATGRRIRMAMSKLLQKHEVYSEATAVVWNPSASLGAKASRRSSC